MAHPDNTQYDVMEMVSRWRYRGLQADPLQYFGSVCPKSSQQAFDRLLELQKTLNLPLDEDFVTAAWHLVSAQDRWQESIMRLVVLPHLEHYESTGRSIVACLKPFQAQPLSLPFTREHVQTLATRLVRVQAIKTRTRADALLALCEHAQDWQFDPQTIDHLNDQQLHKLLDVLPVWNTQWWPAWLLRRIGTKLCAPDFDQPTPEWIVGELRDAVLIVKVLDGGKTSPLIQLFCNLLLESPADPHMLCRKLLESLTAYADLCQITSQLDPEETSRGYLWADSLIDTFSATSDEQSVWRLSWAKDFCDGIAGEPPGNVLFPLLFQQFLDSDRSSRYAIVNRLQMGWDTNDLFRAQESLRKDAPAERLKIIGDVSKLLKDSATFPSGKVARGFIEILLAPDLERALEFVRTTVLIPWIDNLARTSPKMFDDVLEVWPNALRFTREDFRRIARLGNATPHQLQSIARRNHVFATQAGTEDPQLLLAEQILDHSEIAGFREAVSRQKND